jgi:outer membrane protein OmpA-like peptidoglycan-associated protein
MYKYLISIFICFSLTLSAQRVYRTESKKAIKLYEEGLRAYNLQNYAYAQELLLAAIKVDEYFQDAYMVLAEVFWDDQKLENAISYYNAGLSIDPYFYPKGYYNKARLEIRVGKYKEAQNSFKDFLTFDSTGSKYRIMAERGIEQTKFAINAIENPVDFKPINLGPNINTTHDEYWPSLSADGRTLVITRLVSFYDITLGNHVQEDFFSSTFNDSTWQLAENMGAPLNTTDNEGAQSISANGQLMVFTVCNRHGVIGRCDLYYSRLENGRWTYPENMGQPINSTSKETQPSLSADGSTVYFASDRPGGKGKLDIWVSRQNEDGTWSKPENLGDSINTPGEEMSPFIHHDNTTLYFTSDYHIGMGGFDLFMSTKSADGKWGKPKNLGYPINTHRDEIGLIVNAKGNMAYFASDIDQRRGKDIYQFELYSEARPQEVSYLKGRVFDEVTRQRLKARFELYDLADGSLVNKSESDERTGEFLLCLPTNRDYMLNITRTGYLFYSDNFALSGIHHLERPFLKDIPLKPIETGQSIILKNIFYETDSYELRDESQYELNKVVKFLNSNPAIKIEISGHTDNIGTPGYNMRLSENRAKSVVEYLTSKGIKTDRLIYRGYGLAQPLDSNETEEGRANNRRTELKIVE